MKTKDSVIIKKEKLKPGPPAGKFELTEEQMKDIARRTKREFLIQPENYKITTFIEIEE